MPQKLITSPVNLCYRGFPWQKKKGVWGLILAPPSLQSSYYLFFYPTPLLSQLLPRWNEFGSVGLINATPELSLCDYLYTQQGSKAARSGFRGRGGKFKDISCVWGTNRWNTTPTVIKDMPGLSPHAGLSLMLTSFYYTDTQEHMLGICFIFHYRFVRLYTELLYFRVEVKEMNELLWIFNPPSLPWGES